MTPALLCSYYYLDAFKARRLFHFRDWSMDSGAFSAHTQGVSINLAQYTEDCQRLLAQEPKLTEVFALDSIGDWQTTKRNTEIMWAAGVKAIPAYHPGEPIDFLKGLAKEYPKIALGGVVGWHLKRKVEWVKHCFAAIWDAPVKVHAFGMASEGVLKMFPFHSSDASSWTTGPRVWGRWNAFGGRLPGLVSPGVYQEVLWYMRMEHRVQGRWRRAFAKWGWRDGPTVRLATDGSGGNNALFADPLFADPRFPPQEAAV